ncbi:alpha/beta fold hydrolase [Pseudomonas sp. TCU-HL1]|uniref:alpha/beta fold hydrolase n=1 Tax=Pseudomonas sp. TCU-HL1 TaxID=1856685 RepID=UPI000856BE8D|nr:alpha/beta hydrolase [Pseudomonas sp. TCU-HL1]AOE84732.1 alpha/beta hydrolase [Pseudomonas sp. TCU-HL1]
MDRNTWLTLAGALCLSILPQARAEEPELQREFDPLGATLRHWSSQGRTLFYIDEGPREGIPVLLVGGNGTSARVLDLTGFLRSSRERLKLRFISLERNGFGATAYDPSGDYRSYSTAVAALLGHLDIGSFSLLAISGGGPYAAQIAADQAEQLRSVHYAAAFSQVAGVVDAPAHCSMTKEQLRELATPYTTPTNWWAMPAGSAIERVPGWADAAYDDGLRTFFMKGAGEFSVQPLLHEWQLYCREKVAAGDRVKAPVFLYGGSADTSVPPEHMEFWRRHYSNVAQVRLYPGEGHDVQYRHWGQIMADIAYLGKRTLVCDQGKSLLLDSQAAQRRLEHGASLDVCAWAD